MFIQVLKICTQFPRNCDISASTNGDVVAGPNILEKSSVHISKFDLSINNTEKQIF